MPQGCNQRLDAFNRLNPTRPSKLVAHCIDRWGFGNDTYSAVEIQALMEAAVEDGCPHPEVELLAGIGTNGKHPRNCERDLKDLLVDPKFKEAASSISLPIKISKAGTMKEESQTVLWPHFVFATLFNHYRDAFTERLLGGEADGSMLASFWDAVKDSSLYIGHPVKTRVDHMLRAIPISMFGDGVPVQGIGKSWGATAEVFSWSGVLNAKGFSILSQIIICSS